MTLPDLIQQIEQLTGDPEVTTSVNERGTLYRVEAEWLSQPCSRDGRSCLLVVEGPGLIASLLLTLSLASQVHRCSTWNEPQRAARIPRSRCRPSQPSTELVEAYPLSCKDCGRLVWHSPDCGRSMGTPSPDGPGVPGDE